MSQVARVFVVLNLLISAGFLFAAATFLALNNDYKGQLEAEQTAHEKANEDHRAQVTEKDNEIDRLKSQVSTLTEQKGTLTGTVTAQDTQIKSLNSDKSNLTGENARLIQTNGEHATSVQELQKANNGLRSQNDALAAENRSKTKEAADAVAAKETADKQIEDHKATIHEQEKMIAAQKEAGAQKDMMIAYAKSKGVDFEKIEMMPPLSGHVVNADNNLKLVQINIGKAKGMVRGAVFDVVRGSSYIGRMRVDTVFDNQSAGLLTIVADGQMVMVGDRVTNTLN